LLLPTVLTLSTVVRGMSKVLGSLLRDDIEVRLPDEGQAGRVYADPSQLAQIVMNLAVNARDAMPQGGRLTIDALDVELGGELAASLDAPPGSYVLLRVSDTGTGMTREVQARIFEPFFTTKEPGSGTGLGLSTVFGIVRQSGGYIAVASEVGRGTTFSVYLPRTDRPESQLLVVGDSAFLQKPFTRDLLLRTVREVLDRDRRGGAERPSRPDAAPG
jgi:signal transduction histidine kinase